MRMKREKRQRQTSRIEAGFKMMTSNDRRALKEAQAWLEDPRANQSRAQATTPQRFLFITRSFGPVEFFFLPPSTAFALHPRHACCSWQLAYRRRTPYSTENSWLRPQCSTQLFSLTRHSVQCNSRPSASIASLLDGQHCNKVYHGS